MARLLLLSLLCCCLASAAKVPKKSLATDYPPTTDASQLPNEPDDSEEPLSGGAPQSPVQTTALPSDEVTEAQEELDNLQAADDSEIKKPAKSIIKPKTSPTKTASHKPSSSPSSQKNFASPVQFMQVAQPGIDFPNFSMDDMPITNFNCDDQQYPGYYADVETQCQLFHYCPIKVEGQITVGIAFLCPNYTVFDQKTLTCNWVYRVDCSKAPEMYGINSRLYQTALPLIDDEPGLIEKPPRPSPPGKPHRKIPKKGN